MTAPRFNRAEDNARRELRKAIYEWNEHAYDCPLWDYYEDNGGCEECDRHAVKVANLRAKLRKAQGAAQ